MSGTVNLVGGLAKVVNTAGVAVQVCNSTMNTGGGLIQNPPNAQEQKILVAESLYVSIVQPPISASVNSVTFELKPGDSFDVPPYTDAWVTAETVGHFIISVFSIDSVDYPPIPVPTNFPPFSVTGLTNVIYSYLYQEYSDDDDLQGFVNAQNDMQQDYVDTFNALNLPIYTNSLIAGKLADWVIEGLYGYKRPTLFAELSNPIGPLNTWTPNPQANIGPVGINMLVWPGPSGMVVAGDNLYKKCLTWHYQKGDGRYFNIRWLKRRVMRFLIGENGTSPLISQTNQISVTFGPNYECTIRFVMYIRTVIGGAVCNMFGPNGVGAIIGVPIKNGPVALNSIVSTLTKLNPLPNMSEFQQAVQSGVLELPFQFTYTVVIG